MAALIMKNMTLVQAPGKKDNKLVLVSIGVAVHRILNMKRCRLGVMATQIYVFILNHHGMLQPLEISGLPVTPLALPARKGLPCRNHSAPKKDTLPPYRLVDN